jgi:hypothetical protein
MVGEKKQELLTIREAGVGRDSISDLYGSKVLTGRDPPSCNLGVLCGQHSRGVYTLSRRPEVQNCYATYNPAEDPTQSMFRL